MFVLPLPVRRCAVLHRGARAAAAGLGRGPLFPCKGSRPSHSHRSSSLSSARDCLRRGFLSRRSCPRDSPPVPVCALPHPAVLPLARAGDGGGIATKPGVPAAPQPTPGPGCPGSQLWMLCLGSGPRRVTGDTGTREARTAAGHGAHRCESSGGAVCAAWPAPGAPGGTTGSSPAPRQVDTLGSQPSKDAGVAPRPALGAHTPHRGRRRLLTHNPGAAPGGRSWHGRVSAAPAPTRRRGGDSPRSRLQPPRAAGPTRADRRATRGWMPARPPPPCTPRGRGAAARVLVAFPPPRRGEGGREFRRPRRSQTTLRGAAAAGAGCERGGAVPGGCRAPGTGRLFVN